MRTLAATFALLLILANQGMAKTFNALIDNKSKKLIDNIILKGEFIANYPSDYVVKIYYYDKQFYWCRFKLFSEKNALQVICVDQVPDQ